MRMHPDRAKRLLAVLAHVFEKQVAEGDVLDALRLARLKLESYDPFVLLVAGASGKVDLSHGKPEGRRLRVEEALANGVHRHPPVLAGNRREESRHLELAPLPKDVKRPGAVPPPLLHERGPASRRAS
jgi:hypothetical protein